MKTKTRNGLLILALMLSGWIGTHAQEMIDAEVPGDNFSLEGALELFKKSASPEEFEKMLNSADSKVNNLDLNTDGQIDYVRVINRNEGNVHIFIIQAVLSQVESQDVAVIELEKLDNGKAVLQITGDADVYGMETIIEPTEEVRVNAGTGTARTMVNVWTWPSVQYVYSPYYSVWVSPWSWAYHPFWWRPWRPVAYYVYDPWWRPYRPYYAVCHSHRIGYLPRYYRPYRTTSVIVYNNHRHQIDGYRSRNNGRDRYDGNTGGRRDRYADNGRTRSDNKSRDRNYSGRDDGNSNGSRNRLRSDQTNTYKKYGNESKPVKNYGNESNKSRSELNRRSNNNQPVSEYKNPPTTRRSPAVSKPKEQNNVNRARQGQQKSTLNSNPRAQQPSRSATGGRSTGKLSSPSGGQKDKSGYGSSKQRGRH